MTAREFFQAGKLNEAVQALSAELRDNPTDARRRTFLFELLCFQGDLDRARKHLELLAKENQKTGMGALLYEACMHAERTRRDTFEKKDFPLVSAKPSGKGTINGKPFESLEDDDPRIGARLEVFTAGAYMWIPLEHVESIETEAPKRLRDQLWLPVIIRTAATFRQAELGECLIPVLCPMSHTHSNDDVRLGRTTVWQQEGDLVIPYGQKIFMADDEEYALLDIRKIEFEERASADEAEQASQQGA